MSFPVNSSQGPPVCADYQSPYGGRTGKSTAFAQTIAQTQSSCLTLTTAEGDRVTLSEMSRSIQSTRFAEWSGPNSSGLSYAESFTGIEAMGLTVQGDLNEQELADVTRLVGELTSIASDFFSGDHESAMGRVIDFGNFDLGSVSTLAASFSRETVIQTEMSSRQALPASMDSPEKTGRSLMDFLKNTDNKVDEKQDHAELLQERWEQILKALDELKRDELEGLYRRRRESQPLPNKDLPAEALEARPVQASGPPPDEMGPEDQIGPVVPAEDRDADQMMALMEKFLSKHPKFAPFADRLGVTAMEKAAIQADHDRKDIVEQFRALQDGFQNRLQQHFAPPEEQVNTEPVISA